MLINLQGNVGSNISNPIQKTFDDIIFCNIGGKSTMGLQYKNIPPMQQNDIPTEIQIKDRVVDINYTKVLSYNKDCQLSPECTSEIPPFRFQVIYDGYDFLYYPEFKLYERPYLLLEYDVSIGNNSIVFNKTSTINSTTDLSHLEVGVSFIFKDYSDTYKIVSVDDNGSSYTIYLDRNLVQSYSRNDLIVFFELKYELQSQSNILHDSTSSTYSPFKMKFINPSFDQKNYVMSSNMGYPTNYTLVNNITNTVIDLQGDDKIASISNNMMVMEDLVIVLNSNINMADTEIEFTGDISDKLTTNSYFTIKGTDTLEIVKVIAMNSGVLVTVERGQLGTIAVDHNSLNSRIHFPKYVYFILLPYNMDLTKRYISYRNIDFVLTWV